MRAWLAAVSEVLSTYDRAKAAERYYEEHKRCTEENQAPDSESRRSALHQVVLAKITGEK